MHRPDALVLFAPEHEQSERIARRIAEIVAEHEPDARVESVEDRPLPAPGDFTGVVIVTPMDAGRYPAPVREYLERHATALDAMPTAIVPVTDGMDAGVVDRVAADFADSLATGRPAPGWSPVAR